MLKQLTIEQFVIIDKLTLDFQPGLTVLTGETGAGKSILLDAVGLILGEPDDVESVRQGQSQSRIEALLMPPKKSPVWEFLAENGFVFDPEEGLRVRRIVARSGSGEIAVNGKSIELEVLRKAGTFLGEIHGQFANQSLLDPSNQLNLLDLSGGFPPELFTNVADALHDVHRYTRELDEENVFIARHAHELKKIDEIVTRFDRIGMKKGFLEECRAEYSRLLIAKESSETFQSILAQLIAGNGALKALHAANDILKRAKHLERDKLAELTQFLDVALENTQDAVDEMERLAPDYDIDTKPLFEYEEILKSLDDMAAEAKLQPEELYDYYEALCTKLTRIRNGRVKIAELNDLLVKAKNAYRHHCHILSDARVIAGRVLSQAVTAELPPLKLMRAEFVVQVEEKTDIPWTEKGLNVVTFMARLNPGMPFSPISETASGGEMARLVLALKVVLQDVQVIPTLIFDEVDTGIGGAAAAAVGERLATLADNTQVLVITHSPQVASRGEMHLHVSKRMDANTTLSGVSILSPHERVDEISRMLAGEVITSEANAAAQSLINEARTAAGIRRDTMEQRLAEREAKRKAELAAAHAAAAAEAAAQDVDDDASPSGEETPAGEAESDDSQA